MFVSPILQALTLTLFNGSYQPNREYETTFGTSDSLLPVLLHRPLPHPLGQTPHPPHPPNAVTLDKTGDHYSSRLEREKYLCKPSLRTGQRSCIFVLVCYYALNVSRIYELKLQPKTKVLGKLCKTLKMTLFWFQLNLRRAQRFL